MPTTNNNTQQTLDVAIVGGGITGLAAAAALPSTCRWALFESGSRLGGKVSTQHAHVAGVGDFLLETGPDCLLAAQAGTILALLQQLGLANQLQGTTHSNLPVFVWHNNQAVALPQQTQLSIPTQLAALWRCPLLSLSGKLRLCIEPLLPKGRAVSDQHDESVGHFLQRRLGQQTVDQLAEPLLGNIFQLHPNQQSLLATLPQLRRTVMQHGSLLLGMRAQQRKSQESRESQKNQTSAEDCKQQKIANGQTAPMPPQGFVTLRNGMGSWIDAWRNALGLHRLHINSRVQALQPLSSKDGYSLQTDAGQQYHCRCVLLTTPSQQTANMLQQLAPPAAQQLHALPSTSSASVYIAFANSQLNTAHTGLPPLLQGAGLLIPHRQARMINAITCVSSKFAHRAPAGYTLLRAAVAGWRNPTLLQQHNEQAICQQVLTDLQRLLNRRAKPVLTRLFAWRNSVPQHPVGHLQRVQQITTSLPKGIFIAGSPYGSAGLPSCVAQGQQAAQQIESYLL
ncbi:MAG: protoporphyrinogen oxidase [Myxococcota bacterium]